MFFFSTFQIRPRYRDNYTLQYFLFISSTIPSRDCTKRDRFRSFLPPNSILSVSKVHCNTAKRDKENRQAPASRPNTATHTAIVSERWRTLRFTP